MEINIIADISISLSHDVVRAIHISSCFRLNSPMSRYEHPYFTDDDTGADRWVTYPGTLQPASRELELEPRLSCSTPRKLIPALRVAERITWMYVHILTHTMCIEQFMAPSVTVLAFIIMSLLGFQWEKFGVYTDLDDGVVQQMKGTKCQCKKHLNLYKVFMSLLYPNRWQRQGAKYQMRWRTTVLQLLLRIWD